MNSRDPLWECVKAVKWWQYGFILFAVLGLLAWIAIFTIFAEDVSYWQSFPI